MTTRRGNPAKNPLGLWRWMWVALPCDIFFAVLSAWLSFERLSIADGEDDPLSDLADQCAAAHLTAFAWCGLVMLRLTYRLAKNVHLLDPSTDLGAPGWGVAWYFVPFAWLYQPYAFTKQIWQDVFRLARDQDKSLLPLNLWWVVWVATNLLFSAAARFAHGAGEWDPDGIVNYGVHRLFLGFSGVANIVEVVAAILVVPVFAPLARTQAKLIKSLGPSL